MKPNNIQVLVVDDSPVARTLLVHLLNSAPQIKVMNVVENGQAALDYLQKNQPDVVVMDIHMPDMDGFEATRRIMESRPLPIIICTATTDPTEVATTFRSMEAGAVACVEKPLARDRADFNELTAHLLQTIILMSEVKVVRRWPRTRLTSPPGPSPQPAAAKPQIVGIGASTGGPPVLQSILGGMPKDFPLPILVVQHIARGFLPGLADWLNQTTSLQVHIASYGVTPLPAHVYLAPDDFQMGISSAGRIIITREAPESGLRPAVSYLFRSLAEACPQNTIGILLSGMGRDGAAELKLLRDREAITIAQDRETSVVHGMPGEAIALGAAIHILPAGKIAEALIALANGRDSIGVPEP